MSMTELASDFMPLFPSRGSSPPPTPGGNGRRSPYSETRSQARVSSRSNLPPTIEGVLVHVQGSVFGVLYSYQFWLKLVFFYFAGLLVTLYTAVVEPPTFESDSVDNWWDHLHYLSMLFNAIAIVFLAIYHVAVIQRWWAMREALSAVQEGVLGVAWTAASFMPSLESMDMRKLLVRYAQGVFELLWKSAEDDDLEITSLGYLTPSEMSSLRNDPQAYMIVLHWMTSQVLRAKAQGQLSANADTAVSQFMAVFNDIKKGCQKIDLLVNTEHAHPLTQLLSVLVFFATMMFAMEMGQNAGSEQLQSHAAWMAFDAVIIFVLHLFYQGIVRLGDILANPFTYGRSQFPRKQFREHITRTTKALVRSASIIPSE